MKINNFFWMIAIAGVMVLAISCKKDNTSPDETGEQTKLDIEYAGNMQEIMIEMDGQWQAESDQVWCQLVKTRGTGAEMVGLNIAYNTTAEERTATITVSKATKSTDGYTIHVIQKPNTLSVTPPAFTEAKMENGVVSFKVWGGQSGGVFRQVEGSQMQLFYNMQVIGPKDYRVEAKKESAWWSFYSLSLSSGTCAGKIAVGDIPTINKIVIDQSESLKGYNESPSEGTGMLNFVLDGKLYYGGGFSEAKGEQNPLGMGGSTEETLCYTFYCFDPATGNHTNLKNLPFAKGWATVMNGKVYALFSDGNLYSYNTSGDSWSLLGPASSSYAPTAFYSSGSKFYITDGYQRYEYTLNTEQKPVLGQMVECSINPKRVCSDGEGKIWLVNGSVAYLHTTDGYETINCEYPILGAYKGHLYGYHNGAYEVYLLKTDGSTESKLPAMMQIPACLYLSFQANTLIFYPEKQCVTINGSLVLFGGSAYGKGMNQYVTYWKSSLAMMGLNVANCKEPKFLLVTDK